MSIWLDLLRSNHHVTLVCSSSVRNADIVIIVEFLTNGTGPLSQASCAFEIGDSNKDSVVDVLDVVNFIDCLVSIQGSC